MLTDKGIALEKKKNKQIAAAQQRLSRLYKERLVIRQQHKKLVPKRPSTEERGVQVIGLIRQGLTLDDTAKKLALTKETVKFYLGWKIRKEALESLLRQEKASVIRPNEYGGESWNYDYKTLVKEMAEINGRLPNGLSRRYLGSE